MDKFFGLAERKTTVQTEIVAGITTFMTMAYILAVNPAILSACGMDASSVFGATAISAAVATCIMALTANLPVALAPGMGLNAFFAFSVVIGMGHTWQFALTAVFLEGIIFILLTLTNLREAILNCIPASMKKAISAGIGLFIAFIGLQSAGAVRTSGMPPVALAVITTFGEEPALIEPVSVANERRTRVYPEESAVKVFMRRLSWRSLPVSMSLIRRPDEKSALSARMAPFSPMRACTRLAVRDS